MSSYDYEAWCERMRPYPMLKLLEESRVFSIARMAGREFEIAEECDNHFCVNLKEAEVLALATELVGFVNESKPALITREQIDEMLRASGEALSGKET